MPSLLKDYQYDIFISYRQKDNEYDGWVTEFVDNLSREIKATFKEDISIYFDENPRDGLLETHNVDKSLEGKIKSLILIPIISQTYIDPDSFAWQNEFCVFNHQAKSDDLGIDIVVGGGNVASRILPVKIHDLDPSDLETYQQETGGHLRAMDFIFKSPGVNRSLRPDDIEDKNQLKTNYRDQINKTANAIKEIIQGIKHKMISDGETSDASPPSYTGFSSKLRRRHVYRASLVYVIISLLIWKVSSLTIDYFQLKETILTFVTILMITFFPVAIILAWMYERGPGGFIRTSSQASAENPFSFYQRKPLTGNIYILTLIAVMLGLYLFFPQKNGLISGNPENDFINKSIAVLPFVNMSNDPDQEFFSDGIAEELLNALAKIPELKVAGRTSSFSFKNKAQDLKEIGSQLGVATILEGSVRKSSNTIRISAKLVNVEDGFQLWSETYNREMTDVFQIQDEITGEIINALKVRLAVGEEKTIQTKVANIEAYEIYLKARQKLAFRGSENLQEAKELFQKVIQIDSLYAPGWSGLARTLVLLPSYVFTSFTNEYYDSAEIVIEKALELDPENPEIHSVVGTYANYYTWDWKLAEKSHQKALELAPHDAEILNFAGDYFETVGHPILSIEIESKALNLNPLHFVNHHDLGWAYYQEKDWENALKFVESARSLGFPDIFFYDLLIYSYTQFNKLNEAEILINRAAQIDPDGIATTFIKVRLYVAMEDMEKLKQPLERLIEFVKQKQIFANYLAEIYLEIDELDEAAKWMEIAYQNREVNLVFHSKIRLPEELPDHPGIQAALNKPELNNLFEIRRQNRKFKQ